MPPVRRCHSGAQSSPCSRPSFAPGRALSRGQLLEAVSGRRAEAFDRSMDVLVGRLRRKIEADPKAPRLIKTVPGVGYKFAVRPHAPPAPAVDAEPEVQAPVEVLPGRPAAERRNLTVLQCAIISSGELAGAVDPEDWREIVAAFHACCSEVIENFGGAVARSSDDCAVAWFGYPQASEFDAERAVRAGLALISAVPKLRVRRRRAVASACWDCQRPRGGRGARRDCAAVSGRIGRAIETCGGTAFAGTDRCRVDRGQDASAGSWAFRTARIWAGAGGGFRTTDRSLASEGMQMPLRAASSRCVRQSCRRWSVVTRNSNCCRVAGNRQRPAADGSC